MQIFGPASVQNARGITESLRTAAAQQTTQPTTIDTLDQLDLSREAQALIQSQSATDIRADRVADIRSQIQSGRYESADKIHAAVDRLFDELA